MTIRVATLSEFRRVELKTYASIDNAVKAAERVAPAPDCHYVIAADTVNGETRFYPVFLATPEQAGEDRLKPNTIGKLTQAGFEVLVPEYDRRVSIVRVTTGEGKGETS
jgi:hypothetical protein